MRLSAVFIALLILASPALGHHSVIAFYDENRTTEIEGIVTEVFWRNPHTGFTIEAVNAEGEVEEWDQQRVFHMTEEARGQTQAPSHLGYSVGRLEGNTLVVETTQFNWPYLDQDGRPTSENVSMLERYTMSEDETELAYEIVITDPEYLVEPAIWDHRWVYEPGDEVLPGFEEGERFECEVRDTEDSVYR